MWIFVAILYDVILVEPTEGIVCLFSCTCSLFSRWLWRSKCFSFSLALLTFSAQDKLHNMHVIKELVWSATNSKNSKPSKKFLRAES